MHKKYITLLGLIGLLIYYPLLFIGYGFSLDQAFPYYYEWPRFGANNYWLHILGSITESLGIPNMFLEKLVYIGVLSGITYFGYKIFSRFGSQIATTFGILFLHINPFYYGRFIEGQVNVYISYALFVIFFYYFIEYLYYKNYEYWKHISVITLWLCLTSIHNIFLISLPLFLGSIYLLSQKKNTLKTLKRILTLGVSVICINLIWIIPTMMRDDLGTQIQSFGENHRLAFQSPAGEYDNVYFNVFALKGYWGEGEKRFAPSQLGNEYYGIIFFLLFMIICIGILSNFKNPKTKNFTLSLLFLGVISYILGIGVSQNNIFSGLNTLFYQIIPYYSGMREPHKWIVFLVLIYAYFAVVGIVYLEKYFQSSESKKIFLNSFIIFVIALPLIYTPAVMIGFWKQLRVIEYPIEWYEIRENINQNKPTDCLFLQENKSNECYSNIVFPWHGYMNITWTRKPIVLGTIKKFFGKGTLYGDTLETRDIYTQSTRPESKIIEEYIPRLGTNSSQLTEEVSQEFYDDISNLGIQEIILLKEADYLSYTNLLDGLENDGFISRVYENDFGIVYRLSQK